MALLDSSCQIKNNNGNTARFGQSHHKRARKNVLGAGFPANN